MRWIAIACLVPSLAMARGHLADVVLEGVPHVEQEPDFCGEACAEMWLRRLGHPISQRAVFDLTGVDPALGRGAYTVELARVLTRLGFAVGDVWSHVSARRAPEEIDAAFAALHADLLRGVPSIVCTRYDESPGASEHFRLVVGYRARTDSIIYMEPAEPHAGYRSMSRARFVSLWPLKYEHDQWTLRLRLDGTGVITPPAAPAHDDAAFAQHVLALNEKMPRGFSLVVEKPFVVMGDEPAATVQRRAEGTIRWAVKQLRADYFRKDPDDIIDIWLFRDSASYQTHTKSLFGETPDTPYGFYSPKHHALIMNISTGGGTLVHEMVHPFVSANIHDCPAWFNEGLASLFEQSGERDGHIIGLTNWRLAGLQETIGTGLLPSLGTLTSMSDDDFYARDRGDNYGQSRYLFYYLQEQGLIREFVAQFISHRDTDPTGYFTLHKIIGERDLNVFQKRWEKWVLTLRFDG